MKTVYKLTTADHKTRPGFSNETTWGEGVTHSAPGGGPLCSGARLHAYRSPLLAEFMDRRHGNYGAAGVVWECEAEVGKDDGTKVGCTSLTTLRVLVRRTPTTTQRVLFGILCARKVYREAAWQAWSEGWISGKDRTPAASSAAYDAASSAAYDAAYAAAAASSAASDATLDLAAIAEEAMKER